jgi:hypothetical protein
MLLLMPPYCRCHSDMYDVIRLHYGPAVTSQLFWLAPLSDEIFDVVTSKIPPSTSMHFSTLLAIVRVALLRSSWCSSFMGQHCSQCERPIRLLCLLFLCRLRFSSIPTDKNRTCTRQIQTAISPNPLKIGHMFIWTYLLGIFHTITS